MDDTCPGCTCKVGAAPAPARTTDQLPRNHVISNKKGDTTDTTTFTTGGVRSQMARRLL